MSPGIEDLLSTGLEPHSDTGRPSYAGAVAVAHVAGVDLPEVAVGEAVRYPDASGAPLPPAERVPMTVDTIFDLASVTKLVTALVLLTLLEEGRLGLDEPVATWLPSFRLGDWRRITLRHLLTHTAGLPPRLDSGYAPPRTPAPPRRPSAVDKARTPVEQTVLELGSRVALEYPPGTGFRYSDVGYLVAGHVATVVGGEPLDALVRSRVTEPLGMRDTGYRPAPALLPRIAATEYRPERRTDGCVRGEVHDSTCFRLGGVSGHAGLFGTARDLLRLGKALLYGGSLDAGARRILRPETVVEMTRNQLVGFSHVPYGHGLGVRIGDPALAPWGYGHTGFTGTSLLIDPDRETVLVLLTNRIHPSRHWSTGVPVRPLLAAHLRRL